MPELKKNTSLIQKEDVQQLISLPDMKIQVSNSLRHDARTRMFIQNARFLIPENAIMREPKWKDYIAASKTQKLIGSPKRLAITDGMSNGQCSAETLIDAPPFTFEGGSRYSRKRLLAIEDSPKKGSRILSRAGSEYREIEQEDDEEYGSSDPSPNLDLMCILENGRFH